MLSTTKLAKRDTDGNQRARSRPVGVHFLSVLRGIKEIVRNARALTLTGLEPTMSGRPQDQSIELIRGMLGLALAGLDRLGLEQASLHVALAIQILIETAQGQAPD